MQLKNVCSSYKNYLREITFYFIIYYPMYRKKRVYLLFSYYFISTFTLSLKNYCISQVFDIHRNRMYTFFINQILSRK